MPDGERLSTPVQTPMESIPASVNTENMLSIIRSSAVGLLPRVQQRLSNPPVELIYASHSRWPYAPKRSPSPASQPLRISVLDSSFNPPTAAHLALANSKRPAVGDDDRDYNAKLLLLSVRNADKSLKPDDASYVQRLEMMGLLGEDVVSRPGEEPNVAIAIIDEPSFVGKSILLLQFLKHRIESLSAATSIPHLQLTFLVGMDTLTRLLSPKYYSSETAMHSSLCKFLSPDGDDSSIVCARRVSAPASPLSTVAIDKREEEDLPQAKEFLDSGRIRLINIGEKESTYSSSAVRGAIERHGFASASEGGEEEMWRKWVTNKVAEYVEKEKLYIGK